MSEKPTYEELEQRVKLLEKGAAKFDLNDTAPRKTEERFRMFLNNLGDIAYETDSSGNLTYANKITEVITRVPLKDMIGHPFLPLFTIESQQIARDVYQKTLSGKSLEYELTFASGRTCHFKNEPLRNNNDKIIGVFGIARDITERKKAEKALNESEARYRALFENMIDGIAVYEAQDNGEDFIFVDLNKAGETISSITRSNVIGQSVLEMFPGVKDFGLFEVFQDVWRTGQSTHRPTRLYKDNRISFWVENAVFKLPSGEIAAVYSDETKRRQAEESLKQAHDELERRVKERTATLEKTNARLMQEIEVRKQAEKALRKRETEMEIQSQHLLEVNSALKFLLKQRDEDKKELQASVVANVKELVAPYLDKLYQSNLDNRQRSYVEVAKANLNDIISPFIGNLSAKHLNLTPTEVQIANFVKHGKTTKDIAEIRNLSFETVRFHRKNIRKKFGIKNKKINLRTYLLSRQ